MLIPVEFSLFTLAFVLQFVVMANSSIAIYQDNYIIENHMFGTMVEVKVLLIVAFGSEISESR